MISLQNKTIHSVVCLYSLHGSYPERLHSKYCHNIILMSVCVCCIQCVLWLSPISLIFNLIRPWQAQLVQNGHCCAHSQETRAQCLPLNRYCSIITSFFIMVIKNNAGLTSFGFSVQLMMVKQDFKVPFKWNSTLNTRCLLIHEQQK